MRVFDAVEIESRLPYTRTWQTPSGGPYRTGCLPRAAWRVAASGERARGAIDAARPAPDPRVRAGRQAGALSGHRGNDGQGREVAVVTGGASGIGYAISERLSQAGASVVIADRDEESAAAAAEHLGAATGEALSIRTDVTR